MKRSVIVGVLLCLATCLGTISTAQDSGMQRLVNAARDLPKTQSAADPERLEAFSIPVAMDAGCSTWLGYSSPTAQTLLGITWAGTKFVAVGTGGVVVTSPDGVAWSLRYPASTTLSHVAWNGTTLVAVGSNGVIYTSPDAVTWAQPGSPTSNELRGVAWNGSVFVAVGRGGTILSSATGTSWSVSSSQTTGDIFGVAAKGSMFIAIADGGVALQSTDGLTWTAATVAGFPSAGSILGVAASGSVAVAVGFSVTTSFTYATLIYYSADGVTWSLGGSWDGILRGVTWGSDRFVAVGDSTIVESNDGGNWATVPTPLSGRIWDVARGGNTFVAVGANGVALKTCTSVQPLSYAYWVPVSSHSNGLNQSQWRSRLSMLNTAALSATVQLNFFGASGVVTSSVGLPAGTQSIIDDVVGSIGASGSGAIQVLSDQPLRLSARTYNLVSSGANCYPNATQGQDYPVVATTDGLLATQAAYLVGLTENSAFRTNIGVVNTGSASATVLVELFDSKGTKLASYFANPAVGQWAQETQPFLNKAGQTAMDGGFAKVTVQSGTGVFALASVIDNVTNDPTPVSMQP